MMLFINVLRTSRPTKPRIILTSSSFIVSPLNESIWSIATRASLMLPSALFAMSVNISLDTFIPSLFVINISCSTTSLIEILLNSKYWHLDIIVSGILFGSVVAKINIIWAGGSSNVFKNALKAAFDSM